MKEGNTRWLLRSPDARQVNRRYLKRGIGYKEIDRGLWCKHTHPPHEEKDSQGRGGLQAEDDPRAVHGEDPRSHRDGRGALVFFVEPFLVLVARQSAVGVMLVCAGASSLPTDAIHGESDTQIRTPFSLCRPQRSPPHSALLISTAEVFESCAQQKKNRTGHRRGQKWKLDRTPQQGLSPCRQHPCAPAGCCSCSVFLCRACVCGALVMENWCEYVSQDGEVRNVLQVRGTAA